MIDEIIDYKVNRKMEIFRNQYSILCSKLAQYCIFTIDQIRAKFSVVFDARKT